MLVACAALSFAPVYLRASPPAPTPAVSPWIASADKHTVDPLWLYAIALQESRIRFADGHVRPWPWTLHTPNEGGLYFPTYAAAAKKLREVLASGERNVDIGLGQISWQFQGYRFDDASSLLLPANNIDSIGRILRELLEQERGDLRRAIARYHNPRPEVGGPYAAAVLEIFERLREVPGMREALAQPTNATIAE